MPMDVTDPNEWERQWNIISSAPFSALPLIVIAGVIVWWFRGWTVQAERDGLKQQIATLEQRLKLAAEQAGIASRAENEVEKQIQALEAAIAAKADDASLSALATKVDTEFVKLADANIATVSLAVDGEDSYANLRVADCPEILNLFSNNNAKLSGLLSAGKLTSWARTMKTGASKLIRLDPIIWETHRFEFHPKGPSPGTINQTFLRSLIRSSYVYDSGYFDVCLNVMQVKHFWPELPHLEANEMKL